jgi:sodium/potassium/calcium exchanger 6
MLFVDIFSSLAGVTASRPELVFGALFGAGVFVTTVVAGTVAITQPFKVRKLQYSTSSDHTKF